MSQGKPEAALRSLALPLRLTLLGLWAERLAHAFWPFWTLLLAALALPLGDALPLEANWFLLLAMLAALAWALVRGLRRFARPTRAQALARLDARLPGRPIAALLDAQALGLSDPAAQAVWQAHRARMAARAAQARTVRPDLHLAARDVFGLRYMALILFLLALLTGSAWRLAGLEGLAPGGPADAATGPAWEGWAEPPPYTGKPALYLADQTGDSLSLPVGTKITLRFYGTPGSLILDETLSGRTDVPPASDQQHQFTLTRSGRLAVQGEGGRAWQVTALADAPPQIRPEGEMRRLSDGGFRQRFQATDDYGVTHGQAVVTPDLTRLDRHYGLAAEPEALAPLTLDLALPMQRDRRSLTGHLADDLSKDRLANLPVTLTFEARDAAGQFGRSAPLPTLLPGRRFFDPLAAALVEMRRDLMWTRANAPRVAQVLKAISHKPEGLFRTDAAYLRLRALITRLDASAATLTTEARDEMAEDLWAIALMVEEGDLASALDRLRRAQDRVEQAIRNGASPDEIDDLMQEMQDALNDYLRQQAQQDGEGQDADTPPSAQNGQGMQMSQDQLNQMLQKLEELMKQGRSAEAQALMDQLRQMMENLRVTRGDGQGQGSPGDQAMQDLGQTLRDQQGLADDAFRDLQQGPGASDPGGQGLAERQQALRDRLGELQDQGDLPGAGQPEGQEGRRQLDRAGRAMEDAERALRDGDLPGALDRQAEALDALRNGLRNLGEAQSQDRQAANDPNGQQGLDTSPDGQRDPLGRATGPSDQLGSDSPLLNGTDVYRRAQDLLDEIRRRAGEASRGTEERNYLKRLLDLF
jgi:uncharacterized protein (TIGR02302 family)